MSLKDRARVALAARTAAEAERRRHNNRFLERLEARGRTWVRNAFQFRFGEVVAYDDLEGNYHEGYTVRVDGMRFHAAADIKMVMLTGLYDGSCAHEWASGDLQDAADLGAALEQYQEDRGECPRCRDGVEWGGHTERALEALRRIRGDGTG